MFAQLIFKMQHTPIKDGILPQINTTVSTQNLLHAPPPPPSLSGLYKPLSSHLLPSPPPGVQAEVHKNDRAQIPQGLRLGTRAAAAVADFPALCAASDIPSCSCCCCCCPAAIKTSQKRQEHVLLLLIAPPSVLLQTSLPAAPAAAATPLLPCRPATLLALLC
ncbi:unnamed protein product [Closterium sp. NIES-54]